MKEFVDIRFEGSGGRYGNHNIRIFSNIDILSNAVLQMC